ncbi:VOC family protein [Thermoactinospora rubra]|uniref:VOC family protein n=1 Tax=Thermoactinospora rubra TaxID=1088767 RepID=UPI000A114960|nr:VOC family protein [Thermoactinospora rubra]
MIDLYSVTIDCAQPYELASWWSKATGYPVEEGAGPEDEEVAVQTEREPYLLFIRVPEGKSVKNRLHLDVVSRDGRTRDEEVERLLELGATIHEDHRKPDGTGWVTMLDPAGNEFCVCRSEAERASSK